jgi:DNA polymerase/3'-5' exonuclease PolX
MNKQIIDQLLLLATQFKQDGNSFKASALFKGLSIIKELDYEIEDITQIEKIKGIGKGICKRVNEILETGKLSELNNKVDKKKIIDELTSVFGIGVKIANKYMNEFNIKNIRELKEAHNKSIIKLTDEMLIGLKYIDDLRRRISYIDITNIESVLQNLLKQYYPELIMEICGSYRRVRETSGDIDILLTCKEPKCNDYLRKVVDLLTEKTYLVDHLTKKGLTKYMGICHLFNGQYVRIDIRYIKYDSFAPALLYFTGSGGLNRKMRELANTQGYTINEYGVYKYVDKKKGDKIIVKTERDIFELIGMEYLNPREREYGK